MHLDTPALKQAAQQYSESTDIHGDLGEPYHWWHTQYISPFLMDLWNVGDSESFYAKCISELLQKNPSKQHRIVSLGCGEGLVEMKVCRLLLKQGYTNFHFECVDIAHGAIDRANTEVRRTGLAEFFQFRVDKYESLFEGPIDVVIANQVLHHFTELEALFEKVKIAIGDYGIFVTSDMIGRNGHMLWPEALTIVDSLWPQLEDRLKYNHCLGRMEHVYSNWDNSKEANEGIRAQDILGALLPRFNFDRFFAIGNLAIALLGRHFGPNFRMDDPGDRALVEQICRLDFDLIDIGHLKPCLMLACMSNSNRPPSYYRHWSPKYCFRDPNRLPPDEGKPVELDIPINFEERSASTRFLGSGWSSPELGGVWSNAPESSITLEVARSTPAGRLSLDIWGMQFESEGVGVIGITILVDGVKAGVVEFDGPSAEVKGQSLIIDHLPNKDLIQLKLRYSNCYVPKELGISGDVRALAFRLISIRLRRAIEEVESTLNVNRAAP